MNKHTTYYETLGVSENATSDEIQSAFSEKMLEYHSYVDDSGYAYLMRVLIKNAHDFLLNPILRNEYDRVLNKKREWEACDPYMKLEKLRIKHGLDDISEIVGEEYANELKREIIKKKSNETNSNEQGRE
jgi:DnaJ-class molecular chaperone